MIPSRKIERLSCKNILCSACDKKGLEKIVSIRSRLKNPKLEYELVCCPTCKHGTLFLNTAGQDGKFYADLYCVDYAGYRPDPLFRKIISEEVEINFKTRIPPPAKILDAGCGNGELLDIVQKAGYQACGVDTSEAAVSLCLERRLCVERGELKNVKGNNEFDFITMLDFIEHVQNPGDVLRHAFRLLKPSGILVIKTPMVSNRTFQLVKFIPQLAGALLSAPSHIQFFNMVSMQILLKATGFNDIEWLRSQSLHSQPFSLNVKRVIVRAMVKVLTTLEGGRNIYLMARKSNE